MTPKAFIASMNKLCRKWRATMGLGYWDVRFHYHMEIPDEHVGTGCVAWTVTVWPYHMADVHFIVPRLTIQSDKKIEEIIVHEMLHILAAEIQDTAEEPDSQKHVERAVTDLASAMLWVRDAARRGDI